MTEIAPLMFRFVITFILIVLLVRLLKRRGVFNDSHQPVFDRLVTELALPAVIFSSLVTMTFRPDWMITTAILLLAAALCGLAAFLVCRLLGLSPKTTGSVIMASAFGSTATFAIPLITAVYGEQSAALGEAMTDCTLGIAVPFFTAGVAIAVYFGRNQEKPDHSIGSALKDFLSTPIFIAFLLGLVVSAIVSGFQIPGAGAFSGLFTGFFSIINHSVELLVWIAIGLMLHPLKTKTFLPLIGMVVSLKMLLQPALALAGAYALSLPMLEQQVLFIEAAIPSGAIAAVLASRYGCDGPLAAVLVIATYLVSLVTIPCAMLIFG